MPKPVTRRKALKNVATAGAALLGQTIGYSQGTPIRIAGRAVEIGLTSVSLQTVRITIQPIENGNLQPIASDGALIQENWGKPVARLRTLGGERSIKCGDLTVKVSATPLTIRVEAKDGRLVQEFRSDDSTGVLSFQIGDGPVLGLGQGGPQFDRRGSIDRMGSGQGGYQLATHGAKVPIQFAIGTSGWAMFIHQPLGAFDLTGKEGRFLPASSADAALPLDVFVIGAQRSSDGDERIREDHRPSGNGAALGIWLPAIASDARLA